MTLRLSTALLDGIENGSIHKENLEIECVDIFSGPQPYSADDAECGCRLANAIRIPGNTMLNRVKPNVFISVPQVRGTAGWFRAYISKPIDTSNTEALCFDGAIATSGAQLDMCNTYLIPGGLINIFMPNEHQLFDCLLFEIRKQIQQNKGNLHCQTNQHAKKQETYLFSMIRELFHFFKKTKEKKESCTKG